MSTDVKLIYGTAAPWTTLDLEQAREFLPILKKHNIQDLDTAHIYWGSEKKLGQLDAAADFTIHTKAPGLFPGSLKRGSIEKGMAQSLKELKVSQVETYFLHAPDEATPISETMDTIQELYQAGKFKQLGVSNFPAAQLEELIDYAKAHQYVLPSVYEGNYSPITRHLETEIFPLIRQHNMSFFAYSPLAGGFLVKTDEAINSKEGRWNPETRVGTMYQKMYNRPKLMAALKDWNDIAQDAGLSKAAIAYRWVAYHSQLSARQGDAIIVGASRPSQLDDTLTICQDGPLPPKTVESINALWEQVKDSAPIDNIRM